MLRKLFLIVFLLIVGVVGAIASIPFIISEETIRASISGQLSEVSGTEVRLDGEVDFNVFPSIGFGAEDVAIGNEGDAVSVVARSVVVSADFAALFSGQVNVDEVRLENPEITLGNAPEAGNTATETDNNATDADIFKTVAGYLENISIADLTIVDGTVRQINNAGLQELASNLNLSLSAPGLNETLSLDFDGVVQDQKITLSGELGSLADLLNRSATPVSLDTQLSPAPHPLLAEVSANGNVQLVSDGSYRIHKGRVTLADQPVNLDIAYTPGERPHIWTKIVADSLVFQQEDFASDAAASSDNSSKQGQTDYSFTKDIDLNFELEANSIRSGDATAEGVVAEVSLNQGELNGIVSSKRVAKGQLDTAFSVTFPKNKPKVWGRLNTNNIDVGSLLNLAAVSAPVTGQLNSGIQFAFVGDTADAISNSVNLNGEFEFTDGSVQVPELRSALGEGAENITGIFATAKVSDIYKPVQLSGKLNWRNEEVRINSALALRDLFLGKNNAGKLDIQSRNVTANFSGNVSAKGSIAGDLALSVPSVERLVRWVGVANDAPIKSLQYSGGLTASADGIAARNASITVDETKLGGSASIGFGGKTRINADLKTDFLDVDKLTGSSSSGGGGSASGGNSEIDLSALRTLEGQINLSAGRVKYGNIQTGALRTAITIKNSVANIQIPEANFYEGKVAAAFSLNAQNAAPAIAAKINLQNLNALTIAKDASGFDRIEGRLNSVIDITASGKTSQAMKQALAGKADVRLTDGAIRGVDIPKLINNIQTVLVRGHQSNSNEKTEFTEFATTFNIQQGVASSQDLRLLGPLVRMDGSGSINIPNETINMRLNPRVVSSLTGQGGDFDTSGLKIPLIVEGPLAKPKVYPDLTAALRDPEATIQLVSKFSGKLGNITKDILKPEELISKQLEKVAGENGSDIIGGVLQNLGNNNAGNGTSAPTTGGALIGSILQNTLGGGQTPSGGATQPANSQQLSSDNQTGIGIPTRSPRKLGGNTAKPQAAQQPQQALPEPAQKVIDKVVPKELEGEAGNLLKGVLGNILQ